MVTEQRKSELLDIIAHLAGAGDSYYFNMTQELFDKCMIDDHEEEFYKFYCRQREIGFEKMTRLYFKKICNNA